jgi:hypothetical protein
MPELCIVNDGGIVEEGIYEQAEADRLAAEYGEDCSVDLRSNYDGDGDWIEDDDSDD